jgi:hypothetical protein
MTTAISFYQISLGSIIHGLKNAHHFISKGAAHAKSNNVDPNDYLNASLHPDMKDFIYHPHQPHQPIQHPPRRGEDVP